MEWELCKQGRISFAVPLATNPHSAAKPAEQVLILRKFNYGDENRDGSLILDMCEWVGQDSNLRRLTPTGLQPVPISHSGTYPNNNSAEESAGQQSIRLFQDMQAADDRQNLWQQTRLLLLSQ